MNSTLSSADAEQAVERARRADDLLGSFVALSSAARLPGSASFFNDDDDDTCAASDPNLSILKSRTKSGTLAGDLLGACRRLPKSKRKTDLGGYAVVNVGPSVIPTYYPSVRVFTCVYSLALPPSSLFSGSVVACLLARVG